MKQHTSIKFHVILFNNILIKSNQPYSNLPIWYLRYICYDSICAPIKCIEAPYVCNEANEEGKSK